MKAVYYPPAQALLCYHYFSGAQPTHVYLAGLGVGSTGLYPSLIYGSELASYHTLHGVQIAVIPHAGHPMMSHNPAAFVQAISEFIAH